MSDHSLIIKLGLDTADSKKRVTEINKELKNLDKQIGQLDTSTDSFEDNMSNMAKKIDLAKTSVTGLSEKLEEQNKQLEKADKRLQNARKELQEYADSGDKSADKMKKLEQKVTSAQSSFNKLQREVGQTERALETANNELADMEKQLKQMPFDELSKKLNNVGDTLGNISSATAPLTVALAGIGTAGVSAFIDMEGSLVKVKNMLGLTDAEADRLYESARNLASKGFGEFDEVLNTLSNVKLMMGDLIDDSQIEDFSKSVLSIAQTFDTDMNDVLKTSNVLMTNFGISGGEALDIIAWGFQNGLDYSGDFLDTLWEYSVQFADMGYSATEFASMLEKGMQNGIFNTDKLADAVKEANIRLKEMPEATGEAVEKLGLDITKIQSDIAKGGDTAQKAMTDVAKALLEIEDPVERNTIGVEIFGTMWEDAGEAIAESVAGATSDIEGLNGSVSDMNSNIENMNDGGLAELKTKMMEAFQVIGEKLCPVFSDLIDNVTEAVDWFTDLDSSTQGNIVKFGLLLASISPIAGSLSTLCSGLSNAVGLFGKVSGALRGAGGITTAMTGLSTAIGTTGGTGVLGALGSLATAFLPWLVGGAVVVGVAGGVAYLIKNYDDLRRKALESQEQWSLSNELTEKSNQLFAESVKKDYESAKESIEEFEKNGVQLLINSMNTLNEDGTQDFTGFLEHCQSELGIAKGAVEEHASGISSALNFMNTDVATVFSAQDLATIQDSWSSQMTSGLETAYTNLETTINEKDEIIEGLMTEHGVDFETAYQTWEEQVLTDYQAFCDELIIAQTGYQEESLGELNKFLLEQGIVDKKSFENSTKSIEEGYANRRDVIGREYDLTLTAISQGETAINGVHFQSGEQAMMYADLVSEYKLAQVESEKEEELQMAYDLAYQKGIIDRDEYQRLTEESTKRQGLYEDEMTALSTIIEDGATDVGGSWDVVWETVARAEEAGMGESITRNEEFISSLSEFFENGGTDMSQAITYAYDEMMGTTAEGTQAMAEDLAQLDAYTKEDLNDIMGYMDDTGATLDEACDKFDINSDLMKAYIRNLALGVNGSAEDIQSDFENTGVEALSMQGDIEEGTLGAESAIEALQGNSKPAFQGVQEMMDETGHSAEDLGSATKKGLENGSSGANTFKSRVVSALDETERNFISTGGVVSRQTTNMKNDINSVKGKEVTITAKFKSINFQQVKNQVESMGSHVYSAGIPSYKDYLDGLPINFGDIYEQDLYGLKDAGIKTISLAHLDDGISAYATKDSNASDSVSNAVANYNYNNSISTILEPIKDISITPEVSTSKDIRDNGALIHIENMTVRNDNDIKEIAKQLENYIRLHSKKW
ncbi:MAG: phage tail tape measure protein [Bacilli bacterium]|nr:phage tail tape measure protein [Bacilli bacterium]